MTDTPQTPQEPPASDAGLTRHLLAMLASLAGYFRARMELAGLEGKDAVGLYVKMALLMGMAIVCLAFGYAFLWIGLVVVVSAVTHWPWGWLVLAAGVLHFLGVAGCLYALRSLWKTPVFTATLDEFRKDEQWLKSQK